MDEQAMDEQAMGEQAMDGWKNSVQKRRVSINF